MATGVPPHPVRDRSQPVEARIVERRQRRLAARSLGGVHSFRASAIAVHICDENSALPPDTALEAMEADPP